MYKWSTVKLFTTYTVWWFVIGRLIIECHLKPINLLIQYNRINGAASHFWGVNDFETLRNDDELYDIITIIVISVEVV